MADAPYLNTPTPSAMGQPAPASNVPAPTPSDANGALQSASQEVSQQHTSLPAPMPHEPYRMTSASGLIGMLTMDIVNAVAAHKEKQINDQQANFQTIANAHARAEDSVNKAGITDPAQRAAMMRQFVSNDSSVKNLFYGPNGKKNTKMMQKILNVDFSDPESMNTVPHQALKKAMQVVGAQKMMDALGSAFHAHRQSQQQPQQTPEQLKQQQDQSYGRTIDRIESQATPLPTDMKGATDIANAQANLTKANADLTKSQADAKNKFQTKVTANGDLLAFDTSTGKAVPLTDEAGNQITGQTKIGAGEGKVAMVENVPYGITHAGPDGKPRVITPDMPEWSGQDAKTFAAATSAAAAGEANKQKLADRKATFYSSLPQASIAKRDIPERGIKAGELAFPSRAEASKDLTMWAPVAAGDKTLGTQARFGEIQRTVDMTNTAINNLPDTGFDAKSRAQIATVLRATDPSSALSNFFNSEAAGTLSDAQIDYVTSLASMAESAQAMTSLQGIGARGSDKLRASIVAMLPGAGTPSKKYATMQMKKFQTELDQLRKGVPSLGALSGDSSTPTSSASGKGNSRVIKYDSQGNRIQ